MSELKILNIRVVLWWPTMDSAPRIFQLRTYWTDFG